jgi:uncharacterized paraquat-inducible protein A
MRRETEGAMPEEDQRPRQPKAKTRTCLRCDRTFPSRGPENRLCPRCLGALEQTSAGPEPAPLHLRGSR